MTDMIDSWPAGATWLYRSNVANDAAGASDITWLVVPGEGSELIVIAASIQNLDTVARTLSIVLETDTAGETIAPLVASVSTAASATRVWPVATVIGDNGAISGSGMPLIVSGPMRILATASAIALSQDAEFTILARIKGAVPTVTTTGGGTEVVTIRIERVL